MTDVPVEDLEEEDLTPIAHARIVYLGPVAPHWDIESEYGDPAIIAAFRSRVMARLVLLPPHDPQFRRNRERVARDAERERIELHWDLGYPEEEPAVDDVPREADGTPTAEA